MLTLQCHSQRLPLGKGAVGGQACRLTEELYQSNERKRDTLSLQLFDPHSDVIINIVTHFFKTCMDIPVCVS